MLLINIIDNKLETLEAIKKTICDSLQDLERLKEITYDDEYGFFLREAISVAENKLKAAITKIDVNI